ncbi:hypothetical protein V8E55_003423 [Tylopilus felleus]|jgi:protein-S-isoprenylcysteine O-methyltransferase Ste14
MLSSTQLLELFVVLCTAHHHLSGLSRVRSAFVHAQAKSGPVRLDTVPAGLLGTPFTALQAIVCVLLPMIYVFSVAAAGFQQPLWMNALALPEVAFGIRLEGIWKNTARVLACLAAIPLQSVGANVFEHLGDQYHPIGRREKPRVVQTGPYAWVRHPLYSLAIVHTALLSIRFWSYAPLYASVVVAVVFSIKIPIEEEAILRDDGIREEYRAYMRKVPTRLVPYVW